MGFKYNSVVRFNANTDVGLDRVALGSLVTVTDGGVEKQFQYKDDTGVITTTTIATAISGGNLVESDAVVSDTTPQLGGDLDCNGNTINESAVRQITDASLGTGTHTFNYTNGDMQQLTATGNITIAFSNMPTGDVCGFIVDAVNWGAHTITHPAGMLFTNGIAPVYTVAGTDRVLVTKDKDNVYTLTVIAQALAT